MLYFCVILSTGYWKMRYRLSLYYVSILWFTFELFTIQVPVYPFKNLIDCFNS